MATPFNTLINRTIARLSMVSGTSVQTYAEDRIAEMLQHKFDVLFMEYWWPQFMVWKTSALDGTLGVVTDDLTTELKDFLDLRVIYIENTNTPLTTLPSTVNPYTLSGTTPIHFEASTNVAKVFHVWPLASTGNIIYAFRSKPDDFVNIPGKVAEMIETHQKGSSAGDTWEPKCPHNDIDFVRVKIERLLKSNDAACDYYIRLSAKKYVKVINQNDLYDSDLLEKYLNKGLKYFYNSHINILNFFYALHLHILLFY